jgi:hypothetical protein
MHSAAGHGAGDRVEDARLDSRRLVGDDQQVRGVVALKVDRLISRKPEGEVAIVTELEFARLERRIPYLRVVGEPTDLQPELGADLPHGGRDRQHDALRVSREPP